MPHYTSNRHPHRLKENERTNTPDRIITYDCETYSTPNHDGTSSHHLKLGVARYYQNRVERSKIIHDEIVFTTKKEFWDWVESKLPQRHNMYMIAHNQQFDALIVDMYHELPKRNWELQANIVDANMFIVKWTYGTHGNKNMNIIGDIKSLTFIDSLNFFKASIKDIGDNLGLPKGEIEFHLDKRYEDETPEYIEELTTYCRRDVEITERIMLEWIKFIEDYDLGNFKNSLAGQAMSAFRHRFMHHDIFIHNEKKAIDLERNSYRGGRNEAFMLGLIDEHITVLDFNSLYPSVMLGNEYPTALKGVRKQNTIAMLRETMKDYLVIAELTIRIEQPLVAIRKERLIFPIGTFHGTFCSPEIEMLLERNLILKVGSIAFYDHAPIFDEYVRFFYEKRLEAKKNDDKILNELFKIMLNSLYGKFGQRYKTNEMLGTTNPEIIKIENVRDTRTSEKYIRKSFGGKVFRSITTKEETENSFPAIASFCTSYARMKLLYAIEKCEWNCHYVDTDSLFVNDFGLEKLKDEIDPNALGKLKVEYDAPHMTIYGCKDYVINNKVKIKGIPNRAKRLDPRTYQILKFDKFNTSLKKGNIDSVTERYIIKKLKREYTKGTTRKRIYSEVVSPIVLNEMGDY